MNLADQAALQRFLSSRGLNATKGLGQHFLCSSSVVDAIVESLLGYEGILEIGPGPGVLTAPLSERAVRMIAIELDPRMVAALHVSAPKADVLQIDALQAPMSELLAGLPEPRAVVSNLPYYITAPLLNVIARARANFGLAVLMMQREVARRVVAPPKSGERGSLSVYLQALFEISHVADAPASAFLPPPKVDSTVLAFKPKREEEIDEAFFEFVRLCFAQPRKTLVNNLVAGLHVSREQALSALVACGLKPLARAQELTQGELVRLRHETGYA